MNEKFEDDLQLEGIVETLDHAEVRTVYTSDKSGVESEAKGYKAIWNTTKDQLESVIEEGYGLIEHRNAFIPLVRALRSKNIKSNGVVKNHGGTVVIEVQFADLKISEKDQMEQGIIMGVRIKNSYNSRGHPALSGSSFGIRTVCTNGMIGIGDIGSFKVSHTKVADAEKVMADFIGRVMESRESIEEQIAQAIADNVSMEDALEILAGEIGGKKKIIEILKLFKQYEKNRWQLYNALTNFATHNAKSMKQEEWIQRVANKVLVTDSEKLRKGEIEIELETI